MRQFPFIVNPLPLTGAARAAACTFSLLLAAAVGASAQAPAFDSSGNSLLKGTYYFREVIYLVGDQSGALSRALSA